MEFQYLLLKNGPNINENGVLSSKNNLVIELLKVTLCKSTLWGSCEAYRRESGVSKNAFVALQKKFQEWIPIIIVP